MVFMTSQTTAKKIVNYNVLDKQPSNSIIVNIPKLSLSVVAHNYVLSLDYY